MIKSLFNGFTSGLGRTFGRIIAYIIIGYIIYILISSFDIDLSKYLKFL